MCSGSAPSPPRPRTCRWSWRTRRAPPASCSGSRESISTRAYRARSPGGVRSSSERQRKREPMKISIYTTVKNGLYFDYHIVPMLKHHLPFADEIVVNEGYSNDGTYEAIANLDPKIKIIREKWDAGSKDKTMYMQLKDRVRKACTGDWCISLDCDELIPEWEFDRVRAFLPTATKPIVALKFIHFYGNYQVYHARPEKVKWPIHKHPVHRNTDEIEVWGD